MSGDLVPSQEEAYLSLKRNTFVERTKPFLSEDRFDGIDEAVVFERVGSLVDLPDLDDFERLHHQHLRASGHTP